MDDILTDVVRVAPPVGINTLLLAGLPLAHWVIILNFAYITVLLVAKLWSLWKEHRGSK